jgi:hypothetical protein
MKTVASILLAVIPSFLMASAPGKPNGENLLNLDKNMVVEDEVANESLDWYNPMKAPFSIYGLKWIGKDSLYRRLPMNPPAPLPEKVNKLANAPAGGQIHFTTNSRNLDAYKWEDGYQRFVGVSRFEESQTTYTAKIRLQESSELSRFSINCPLYNGVKTIHLGFDKGSEVSENTAYAGEPCIVVYGTSITQGSAASRPGMAYPNILSRLIGREVVNLGFSGAGKGEPVIADCINDIPGKGLIVLDFECNTHDALLDVLEPFIHRIRKSDTGTPILVLSRIHLTRDATQKWQDKRKRLTKFQKNLIQSFRNSGDDAIYFIDGRDLIDEEWKWEATVDGTHATDLGFSMMAKNLKPVVLEILNRHACTKKPPLEE